MSAGDYTNIRSMRIADDGSLVEDEPRTWDGEPLWSVDTVAEGLFDRSAFQQLDGQLAIETDDDDVR